MEVKTNSLPYMKKTTLTLLETEELVGLVEILRLKLKRKHQHLTVAKLRLGKAKDSIHRLQGIVTYQRERILELYKEQVPFTREIIDATPHDQKLY
jgi:hypothetical protein